MEKKVLGVAGEVRAELVAIERMMGALNGRVLAGSGSTDATVPTIQKCIGYLNLSPMDEDAVSSAIRATLERLIGYRTDTLKAMLVVTTDPPGAIQEADLEGRR